MGEWISTKDRLPEEGMLVLCCLPYGEMAIAWYSDVSKMWFSPVFDNYVTVNYWQPLPEPPKEDLYE